MSAHVCVSLRMHVHMFPCVSTHMYVNLCVGEKGAWVGEVRVFGACTSVGKCVFVLSCFVLSYLSAYVCARAFVCVCK